MSLIHAGGQCYACPLVDFLPFTCTDCSHTFCRDHVNNHECVERSAPGSASSTRVKSTCAYAGCSKETIESMGGLDVGDTGPGIARQVRCACGQAFCPSHRSQEAHDCTAPRELTARHDAILAKRQKAQEILAKTMPEHAGKERLVMPPQVDRTRSQPPPRTSTTVPTPSSSSSTAAIPPSTSSAPTPSSAEDKLFKLHTTKLRSLAKSLDPKASRDESVAVEWAVDEGGAKVRQWAAEDGKYAPHSLAAALCDGKPQRTWIPKAMPVGRIFDSLLAEAKLSRAGAPWTLLHIATKPGSSRTPLPLDLSQPVGSNVATGDVLVLVRGW